MIQINDRVEERKNDSDLQFDEGKLSILPLIHGALIPCWVQPWKRWRSSNGNAEENAKGNSLSVFCILSLDHTSICPFYTCEISNRL